MEICDTSNCTGCQLCHDICPVNAIEFVENEKGFKYPKIKDNCINCGLCKKNCPVNNVLNNHFNQVYYACWNKDDVQRNESSSGGVFYLLAEYILNQGGIVVGVSWTSKSTVHHIVIDNIDKLYLLQKSKYVQSNTKGIFKYVKKALVNGKKVLFSGTPCQVAALKMYLNNDQLKNIILIDVICHGVPNERVLRDYLDYLSDYNGKSVRNVDFRYKKKKWKLFKVKVTFEDGTTNYYDTDKDSYFILFNKNYILRDSCYHCKYAQMERYSDITLGDFWNYFPLNFKMRKYQNGISCVTLNSERGVSLFNKIKHNLLYEERNILDVKNSNYTLTNSFDKNKNYDIFWEKYIKYGYKEAISILDLETVDAQKISSIIKIKAFIKSHIYVFPKFIQNILLRRN